jgi:hypothetical protein
MSILYRSTLLLCLTAIAFSCESPKTERSAVAAKEISPEFKKVLDAHGDWSKWINAEGFSYASMRQISLRKVILLI